MKDLLVRNIVNLSVQGHKSCRLILMRLKVIKDFLVETSVNLFETNFINFKFAREAEKRWKMRLFFKTSLIQGNFGQQITNPLSPVFESTVKFKMLLSNLHGLAMITLRECQHICTPTFAESCLFDLKCRLCLLLSI